MSSPETERTLEITPGGFVSRITIKRPLDTLEQYRDVCAVAYDLDYSKALKLTEQDFERSLFVNVTEFLFARRPEAELQEVAQRIVTVLTEKHQLPASFAGIPAP